MSEDKNHAIIKKGLLFTRHGVKYIEMYLNTNTLGKLRDSKIITNTFKAKVFKYKYSCTLKSISNNFNFHDILLCR